MPDPVIGAPAPAAPTDQRNPKSVANNIVQGIHNRANGNGKAPAGTNDQPQPDAPVADPNAGKEKYVVEGKEVWLTSDQARAYVQKGIAFEPKVDQLNRLQQETNAFMQTLATDPLKILLDKRIGMTSEIVLQKVLKSGQISPELKEMVGQWYYENVVEPLKLSPQELEARENKKKLSSFEQQEKDRQDAAIRQENQAKVNRAMNELKTFIGEAMKQSGLPSNDTPLGAEMARMVADTIRVARRQQQAITPTQAIEFVKSRMKAVQAAYYDHLDGETLVKELGPANAEKVKKYFLKLVQPGDGKGTVVLNGHKPAARNGERKTINMDQFHDMLDDIKKKG